MSNSSLMLKVVLLALVCIFLGFCLGYAANDLLKGSKDSTEKTKDTKDDQSSLDDDKDSAPADPTVENEDDDEEKTLDLYLFDQSLFETEGSTEFTRVVSRTTTRADVATFLIEQLIIGPTSTEEAAGLKDTFGEGNSVTIIVSDPSSCGGSDFSISIVDRKATVQFCRETMLAGDMSGFIVREQIVRTLVQFSTIDMVRVLNKAGACFGDLSGRSDTECYYE